MSLVEAALGWANPGYEEGWYVFPVNPADSDPYVAGGFKSASRDEQQIRRWWAKWPDAWIAVATGRDFSRIVAVDVDVKNGKAGRASWKEIVDQYGQPLTWKQKTKSNGRHFIFRHPGNQKVISKNDVWPGIDVKADGGYIVIAPSEGYEVIHDIPPAECPQWVLEKVGEQRRGYRDKERIVPDALVEKLGPEGERNDSWVKLCGHLAKKYRRDRRGYDASWKQIAAEYATEPYERLESAAERIWDSEQDQKRHEWNELNGYLVGDTNHLYTQVREDPSDKDNHNKVPALWGTFDFEVLARGHLRDQQYLSMSVGVGDRYSMTTINANTFADDKRLNGWLASIGASVLPPKGELCQNRRTDRLMRYQQSQPAPEQLMVEFMGGQEDGRFLIPEQQITPTGPVPSSHMFIPRVLANAQSSYGWMLGDVEAVRTLMEVSTFQEPEITWPFLSWLVACQQKHVLLPKLSEFPYVAVPGASGSGKSKGFFEDSMALFGTIPRKGKGTYAVYKRLLSSHRNCPIMIDDLTWVQDIADFLRWSAVEDVFEQVNTNNHDETVQFRFLRPIVLMGESLALLDEKAQRDRSIRLEPQDPSKRPSVHGLTDQWADRNMLLQEWGGQFNNAAGRIVSLVQRHSPKADDFRASSKWGSVCSVLRYGAHTLSNIIDSQEPIDYVEAHIEGSPDLGAVDTLITTFLPNAIAHTLGLSGLLHRSALGSPIVFVDQDGLVNWSERLLEQWLARYMPQHRLGAATALAGQRKALGVEPARMLHITRRNGPTATSDRASYYRLNAEMSKMVLAGLWQDSGTPLTDKDHLF